MRYRVENPLQCVKVQVRARQLQVERTESLLNRRDTSQEGIQLSIARAIPKVGVIRKVEVQQVILLVVGRLVRIQHARRHVHSRQLLQDAVRLREVDVGVHNAQLPKPLTRLTTETVQHRIVETATERVRT